MRTLRTDVRRDLSFDDYEAVHQKLIEACRRRGIPHDQVGLFGSVTSPGISDLDALIIGEPAWLRRVREDIQRLRQEDPRAREILWHEPVYLLQSISGYAAGLHTFHGLAGSMKHIISDATPLATQSRKALDHVWFTFLAAVCTRMTMQRVLSQRAVLLIQKNLEVSAARFASKDGRMPSTAPCSSQVLREGILEGRSVDLLKAFHATQDHAFRAFDATCAPGSERVRDVSLRRLGRRVLIRRAPRSGITPMGPVALLSVREPAFMLSRIYRSDGPRSEALDAYVRLSREVAAAYSGTGLPYPFVTPFSEDPHQLGLTG
jgi:hypothetical protein